MNQLEKYKRQTKNVRVQDIRKKHIKSEREKKKGREYVCELKEWKKMKGLKTRSEK